jgi:uncharacterized membrane protein YdfJ with MMPL/SSD domain
VQTAMDRLGSFIERRRWLVLGAWIVVLLAAAPFAARQTDHLTGGGFTVSGSGSERVDQALTRFPGAQRESLAAVLQKKPGATAADVRTQIDRVDAAAARLPNVELTDAAEARAKQLAGRGQITIVSLTTSGARNDIADMAVDLRKAIGAAGPPRQHVQPYLVGQQALWAGMQDLTKKDLA